MNRRDVLGAGVTCVAAGFGAAAWGWPTYDDDLSYAVATRMLVNTRRAAGQSILMPCPALTEAARRQVQHMAEQGALSHKGAIGDFPNIRARSAGFSGHVLGETLAETHHSAENTMAVWLSEPETRDVLMEAEARMFGLAAARGPDGRIWWSLLTGA